MVLAGRPGGKQAGRRRGGFPSQKIHLSEAQLNWAPEKVTTGLQGGRPSASRRRHGANSCPAPPRSPQPGAPRSPLPLQESLRYAEAPFGRQPWTAFWPPSLGALLWGPHRAPKGLSRTYNAVLHGCEYKRFVLWSRKQNMRRCLPRQFERLARERGGESQNKLKSFELLWKYSEFLGPLPTISEANPHQW